MSASLKWMKYVPAVICLMRFTQQWQRLLICFMMCTYCKNCRWNSTHSLSSRELTSRTSEVLLLTFLNFNELKFIFFSGGEGKLPAKTKDILSRGGFHLVTTFWFSSNPKDHQNDSSELFWVHLGTKKTANATIKIDRKIVVYLWYW